MYKFKFADIGEGLHEGTVGEVLKKVGDKVNEGDSLFVVETDKVTSEIPSPVSGIIKKVLIKTGETVHVGDEVFYIDDGKGDAATDQVAEAPDKTPETKAQDTEEEGGASVVGEIKVSNELFSTDIFKKSPKPEVPQVSTTTAETTKTDAEELNPKPVGDGEKVDVVVVGSGPGGYSVAEELGKAGFKTVIIEKEHYGGVCLNVGCIPTKTLLKSAKVYSYIKEAKKFGVSVDSKNSSINWKKMLERKNQVISTLRQGVKYLLTSSNVEIVNANGQILDRYNVKAGSRTFTTKFIIISTGSSPIDIPVPGAEEAKKKNYIIDSTGALSLKSIPKSLVIIGGGVIGVEFASLYNELGTKVTILEGSDSILSRMDQDIKKEATKLLESKKIQIITNARVTKIKDNKVTFQDQNQKARTITGSKILVSIGRRANSMNLDKTIGLKLGARKEIVVNDFMQTNINNIFAIGDVVGHAMLAHAAYNHAHIVASYLQGKKEKYYPERIPGCIYTHPEISSIGLTEHELKAKGISYVSGVWQNKNLGKALADGEELGFTKILVGKKYGEILGAHIINSTSSDMIAEIGAVMKLEGTIYELATLVHPHPATAEAIYEAARVAKEKLKK